MLKSKRRPAGFSDATVELIVTRDKALCAWCGRWCGGFRGDDWQIHHRRPRAAGGTSLEWVNQPANGLLLHPRCHADVESNRTRALALGFLIYANSQHTAVAVPVRHAVHGPVHLLNDGSVRPISDPLFAELMTALGQKQGEQK